MKTAVAFNIFNRPDTTEKSFEVIRQAQPPKLLVIADAPRPNRPGEAERCTATRAIIDRVDWNCEVLKNYSDVNLGCQKRVSSGLDWVFSLVEEAIIIEDDCLPDPSFFRFCEELLDYYRQEDRVMAINGQNNQFGRRRDDSSYYFSRYFHCWGWATWSRAWKHYDVDLQSWPTVSKGELLHNIFKSQNDVDYWRNILQETYEKKIDTWDYQWLFACWLRKGLIVNPNVNLISNIGFGSLAANTVCDSRDSLYANMKVKEMLFPLKHPSLLTHNQSADKFTQETVFNPSLITRVRSKISRVIGIKSI